MHCVPTADTRTCTAIHPRCPVRRVLAAVCMVMAGMQQSACTVIEVHGDGQVATRMLPGIAVINISTRPGTASYAHVRTVGLSVQQRGFVFGLASTETIHADPGEACFSLTLDRADTLFGPSTFSCQASPKEQP